MRPVSLTETGRFLRYGMVGLITNLSLYLLFLLLLQIPTPPVLASGVCYVLGVALSYVLNRRWTFASTDSHRKAVPKFVLAYGIGLGCTLVTMGILTSWLRPELAQILNAVITAIVIYASLRLLRFGRNDLIEMQG